MVRTKDSKSNHLGSNNETLVRLVEQLSNPAAPLLVVLQFVPGGSPDR
jgi:hypothetical protein